MELPKKARTIALLLGGVALVAVVYAIPLLLKAAEPEACTIDGVCQHELFAGQVASFVPLALLLGIAIGAAAHYLFLEKSPLQPKVHSKESAYLLLDSDERKIVSKINEQNGRALQSEISRMEGMGKVKAHRLLARMSKRGILEIESFGKTNTVRLSKGVKGLFD